MDHRLLQRVSFWAFLFSIDRDLAATTCQAACSCGGRLHRADYPRKPRGGPNGLPREYMYRLSFCCSRDGCRKRATPPSVRFLGRKVYLHAVVSWWPRCGKGRHRDASASWPNCSTSTAGRLCGGRPSGAKQFPQTAFWKVASGQLALLVELADLPRALLTGFFRKEVPDPLDCWKRLLVSLADHDPRGPEKRGFAMTLIPAEDAARHRRRLNHPGFQCRLFPEFARRRDDFRTLIVRPPRCGHAFGFPWWAGC
jgi:hypothetical protein